MAESPARPAKQKLAKDLGLWDVYAISTGAMFSSGFFLLPGLATAYAGPSTVLAYLVAGILMVPAMLSMAELSTALPRAGGTYFFLDRSLGPGVGTVGGLGTWLALVLKSAFALLGMGAYLAIAPGVASLLPGDPDQKLWVIKGLAVALTVAFAALNLFGAKETTKLQGILVIALLSVLAFFLVQGLWYVAFKLPEGELAEQYTPFFHTENGFGGFFATVGLVFVSYAGLTKVASVSEEVKRPDRNLPLGMFLSLITATTIYVLGVAIMIATVDPGPLRGDYTPVATSAERFFNWLPGSSGIVLIVIAALAAFASTGNAGILAASRYPLAMGRDRLVSPKFTELGRYGTPTWGIVVTAALMIFFIVALSAEGVAKVASAFNLFVFGLMNVSVIVMRQSRISSYDPGFRSPLYPWMQLAGVVIALALIYQMGMTAVLASGVLALIGAAWYVYYARDHVERHGAIFHWFALLGKSQHDELDNEFRQIMVEKGARQDDPFDDVVTRATVLEAPEGAGYHGLIELASEALAKKLPRTASFITEKFVESGNFGFAPMAYGAVLPHFRSADIEHPELVIVRSARGFVTSFAGEAPSGSDSVDGEPPAPAMTSTIHAMFLLVSPEASPGVHLRILAHLAGRLEKDDFMPAWLEADGEQALKEILLRDERFVSVAVDPDTPGETLVDQPLHGMALPDDVLVAMIRRRNRVFVPRGGTVLRSGDRLTVIGEPESLVAVAKKYAPQADILKKAKPDEKPTGRGGKPIVAPVEDVVAEGGTFAKD